MAKFASDAHLRKHQRAGLGSGLDAGLRPVDQVVMSSRPQPCPDLGDAAGRGTVTQLIGPPASRKADAAMALLVAAAEDGLPCAWVEARASSPCPARGAPAGWTWHRTGVYAAFALYPRTGPSTGVPVERYLPARHWRRQQKMPGSEVRRGWRAAFHAALQLLAQRRWAVVVLHLGGVPPAAVREVPPWTRAQLREAAGRSGTALLVLGDGRPLDFGGSLPDEAIACIRFEARRLRGPHGLRRRPAPDAVRPAKRFLRGRQDMNRQRSAAVRPWAWPGDSRVKGPFPKPFPKPLPRPFPRPFLVPLLRSPDGPKAPSAGPSGSRLVDP